MKKKMLARLLPQRGDPLAAIAEKLAAKITARLDAQLAQSLRGYDPDEHPLGRAEAEAILQTLIRTAAAGRALLPGLLQQAVENDRLPAFADRYKQLDEVCRLSVQMEAAAAAADRAQEEYRYLAAVYGRVRANAYDAAVQPTDEELAAVENTDRWDALAAPAEKEIAHA